MSLIHWYPLNNSLEDLGCGQAIKTSISGTPTFSNTGKTGNYCLTASETLAITDSTLAGARVWSCCFWGYVVSASITNNWLGLFHITDGSSNIRVEVCPKGNYVNDIYCYSIHNNYGNAIFSSSIPTSGDRYDCWAHFAITCDGSSISTYINGNRMGSIAYNGSGTITGSFRLINNHIVRKNDLRIYDHALSAKEVKEISKGLVLHYNFEDEYIEPTTNIGNTSSNYSNMNKGTEYGAYGWGGDAGTVIFYASGGYNNYPYKVYHKTATGSGGIYYKTTDDITIEAGKTYTMSIYIKASVNINNASAYSFNINRNSDNFYINYGTSFNITTEWQRLIKTFTATSSEAGSYGEMSIIYDDTPTDYYIYYSGFQIEEKDHATPYVNGTRSGELAYDSSGYSNNGNIFGDLQILPDSASGRYSAVFNGLDTAIQTPNLATLITDGIYTINLWFNVPALGSKPWGTFYGGPSGYEFSSRRDSTPTIVAYSWGQNSSGGYEYNLNTWYMLTVVRTTSGSRWYINGELYYTGTAGSIPSGNYFIGAWSNATLQNFNGKISDFKIFATAFSTDDVLAEYNRKAAIDKNGNLFTGEIIETTYNLLTSENLLNGRVNTSATSNVGEIVTRNNYSAYRISPVPYWSGDGATSKNICKGQFGPGQYIFDLWIDVDEVYYDGNGQWVPGGFEVYYTDGSVENIIIDANSTQGHSGYQHLVRKTNANKTISGLGVYYYIGVPIYIRCDSVICKVNSDRKICKNNIIAGGQFVEPAVSDSKCKLTRYGVVSNAVKEL